jgi:hypothetical protein
VALAEWNFGSSLPEVGRGLLGRMSYNRAAAERADVTV